MKSKISIGLVFKFIILGISWTMAYNLAFLQYTLYDPLLETFQCTNAQLGFLLTIFGIFNILGAPIGGWLSDKFNFKVIYVGSMVVIGAFSAVLLFNSSYTTAIFVWIGLGIGALLMNYPAHVKIIHAIATEGNAGKYFGFNESFCGVGGIIISALVLYVFNRSANAVGGIHAVVVVNTILCFVVALANWFILRDVKVEKNENDAKEKISGKDFLIVLKSPKTWILALGIFSVYTCACSMSYFTPYYTAAFGGTVTIAGALAVIRLYGMKLIGGPIGGALSDKLKSPSKVLILVNGLIIICYAAAMLLNGGAASLFIALILLVAIVVYMGKGSYYAVSEELNIPQKYAATSVGIAAALGFSPDIFIFVLIGHWIDKYGVTGYRYTFIFQICIAALGICASLLGLRFKKKNAAQKTPPAENAG